MSISTYLITCLLTLVLSLASCRNAKRFCYFYTSACVLEKCIEESLKAELDIRSEMGWPFIKVGTFYRLLLGSPLEMFSKFVLANWICLAKSLKMVGKWPMADCYFKL